MKRQPKAPKPRRQAIQAWTYPRAQSAAPYITSIVRAIREHALALAAARAEVRRLADRPGRPDRTSLINQQEAMRDSSLAESALQEALEELENLHIFSLDPFRGTALIPFLHEDQGAWYIFDLFDPKPMRFWRFQGDPEDTCRPITSLQQV